MILLRLGVILRLFWIVFIRLRTDKRNEPMLDLRI